MDLGRSRLKKQKFRQSLEIRTILTFASVLVIPGKISFKRGT
jgi:hypothetical protein